MIDASNLVGVQETTIVQLPLDRITSKLSVRRLSASGIARLQESMRWAGFLDNFPLVVTPLEFGDYELIEGNHRYEAAKGLGIPSAPCIVKANLSAQERYRLAMQSNNAAETIVSSTLVTYAEFVWARAEEEYTQQQIATMLGWGRTQVANYVALKNICSEAWRMIVTTFEGVVTNNKEDVVTRDVTTVTITERLLRDILPLTPEQQTELVTDLATDPNFSKGKFKTLAENYQARNEMYLYAKQQLGDIGEIQLREAVYSGAYDADWKQTEHPKLHKLITAIRDEWEQKNSTRLIHGDFYEEVKKIADRSIDLILTDPPYNVARENEFELDGRKNISQDFGSWDKQKHSLFVWAQAWARILREQGSGYVFTQDSYISSLREALEEAGLHVKATIAWHKTNPGTQIVRTNFKSSIEYILFFTKGQGGHTFNWQGENEMHNFINAPICGGGERVVDAKGNVLHPTQKPEQVIRHFLDISSNRGDIIFDGFMGVGTSGKVAKDKGRKFIGIEQDNTFFEAAQRRLAE